MTTTCSNVVVVQNELYFLLYKAPMKNAIYTSMIQSVIEYEIVSCLMVNSSMLIAGSRSKELQSMELEKVTYIL
jgi:hypothetical protein